MLDLLNDLKNDIMDKEADELGLNNMNENYKILDSNQANFFLKRLTDLEEEKNEINEMCNSEIEKFTQKVNDFRNGKLESILSTESYFTKLLQAFAESELKDSKKKSIKLPFGVLKFTKEQTKYSYDENALLKYLNDNKLKEFIKIKENVNNAEVKKAIKVENDKIYINELEVPGIEVIEGNNKFSVKLN